MKKFYIGNENELNEEEKKTGKVSYLRLANRFCQNRVLCNNIDGLDNSIWDNFIMGDYEDMDIYQYFLVDMSNWEIEWAKEMGGLILSYSNMLDLYVLMVDHCGTGWDYVMTEIEWSTDHKECE